MQNAWLFTPELNPPNRRMRTRMYDGDGTTGDCLPSSDGREQGATFCTGLETTNRAKAQTEKKKRKPLSAALPRP
jgi:hypothetical protein